MSMKINPPSFQKKSYERYKQELHAWRIVTEIDKKKQGIAIALSLPEDDSSGIREKVFDEMKLDDLKTDDGFEKLITFLDGKLGKDDLTDSLEKFEDFENYQREENQSITDYIAKFDQKYNKMAKLDIKLPSSILGFKLLRKASITKNERMLVLTGMDYSKRDELYEQAKKSLMKFKGEQGSGAGASSSSSSAAIKLEPTLLTKDDAYWSSRYRPSSQVNARYTGGPNRRGRGRAYHPSQRGTRPGKRSTRPLNPTGPDGNPLLCISCGSYRHLISDCPDSWEKLNGVNFVDEHGGDSEEAVLFTGNHKESLLQLISDSQNCAVLDSACSSTVCGRIWMDNYIDSLYPEDKQKIKISPGFKTFKFGGGEKLKSSAHMSIPATIAGKKVFIKTDVVESDIPLLLSKESMKRAKVKLDLAHDAAKIFGQPVALNLTSSGHYCIPLTEDQTPVDSVKAYVVSLHDLPDKEKYKKLLKLHRQFAHPSEDKLKTLLIDAGVWTAELQTSLSQVYNKCEVCKIFKQTPPRPAVTMPMAHQFNEVIAMDLKKWKDKWILHIIDVWSRYTMSVIILRKTAREVLNKVLQYWISVFGIMRCVLTDNGGEFTSEETREVASILDVKLCTTAADSPFQNGLCERNHAVIDNMLRKLTEDHPEIPLDILICWAVMAKNTLQMCHGFSSHQLVFGTNPNLPNILTAKPASLESTTSSEVLAQHLNALHASRKAFIESESAERIRRALRCKIRASEEHYQHGDTVYYKREQKERWLGPAKVVFQDGKVIFVRHGSVFIRVSPNRVIKAGKDFSSDNSFQDNTITKQNTCDNNNPSISGETIGSKKEELTDKEFKHTDNVNLKPNDIIEFRENSEDNWKKATVLSRAGKVGGKNKNWFNLQPESGDRLSVDLGRYQWNKIDDVQAVLVPTNRHQEPACIEAKQAELRKLQEFGTYEEVSDTGQFVISTRWVLTEKDDKTVKARLVARGFEEDFSARKDSPTIERSAMKLFLGLAASFEWTITSTDIKSAFLQGMPLDREVFINPPPEADIKHGVVWKLKHCLYGLNDGARQFYLSVKEHLLSLGCVSSTLDPAFFCYKEKGKLKGMICCHIDDFLHAGTATFQSRIVDNLTEKFSAGKIKTTAFTYLGFEIEQKKPGIILQHCRYIDEISEVKVSQDRASYKRDNLTDREQTTLRKVVGRINWVTQGSRPDMAFDLIELSTKLKRGTIADLLQARKAIKKLKSTDSAILFPALSQTVDKWSICVYSDAAHANICDGTCSVGAHIVFLADQLNKCCPLHWQANKIKRIVRSTLAAETLSLLDGLDSACYLQKLFSEIMDITLPITAYVDNKGLVNAVYSTCMVDEKRLRLDVAAIKESLTNGDVKEIKWCLGSDQLANCMTKRGAGSDKLLLTLNNGHLPEHDN